MNANGANRKMWVAGAALGGVLCACCALAAGVYALGATNIAAPAAQPRLPATAGQGDGVTIEAPTLTPLAVPTVVAATSEVEPPAPEFEEVYRFEGEDVTTTDPFRLQGGIVRIGWDFTGDSNSALVFKRLDSERFTRLLVNEIGAVSGQAVLTVEASDLYVLEITGRGGAWTVVVEYRPM